MMIVKLKKEFCRIQNLHISQTGTFSILAFASFVEFKIYISLKHVKGLKKRIKRFVEFKIYISLKQYYTMDKPDIVL